jgi:hypothetical protein
LAAATPALSPALHAHLLVIDQPSGAMVRQPDREQIRRGTHRSTRALEDAIRLYVKLNNETPSPSCG